MSTEPQMPLNFAPISGKSVEAKFDGGNVTSDAEKMCFFDKYSADSASLAGKCDITLAAFWCNEFRYQ